MKKNQLNDVFHEQQGLYVFEWTVYNRLERNFRYTKISVRQPKVNVQTKVYVSKIFALEVI